jgi:GTPase
MKTGFVGLVGPTNSGKSTLMNALIGQKVSIVSPRVQTTYHSIKGIRHGTNEQMIFSDTPGFQNYPSPIPRLLNKMAEEEASGCDILVWVFDASHSRVEDQIEKLEKRIRSLKPKEKTFCVLNKVDKIAKPILLPLLQRLHKKDLFADVVPLSALKKDNLQALVNILTPQLPEGEAMYEEDAITDRPLSFLASELVREQIYRATVQEIPYACRVEIEEWENPAEGEGKRMPEIRAVIHVESSSQKGILIGKQGSMLKRIGTYARKEIEKLTGTQVVLKIHVDVEEGWTGDKRTVQNYLGQHSLGKNSGEELS